MNRHSLVSLFSLFSLATTLSSATEPNPVAARGRLTGNREGTEFCFRPTDRVAPGLLGHPNPGVAWLAERIRNGSASLLERRAYHGIEGRLWPYDQELSPTWRLEARAQRRSLAPRPMSSTSGGFQPTASLVWSPIVPSTYVSIYGASDYTSGRATAFWINPSDPNHFLLGTADGGLWRSTTGGTSWAPIFDSADSGSIGSIGVDPNDSNVIYVGTGEGNFSLSDVSGVGIYKSTNGGTSWSLLSVPFPYAQPWVSIRRIVVDPRDSQRIYAAGDGGLFYSLNGGTSWTRTTCGALAGWAIATDVILDSMTPTAGQPSIVYVAFGTSWGDASNGIYRSTTAAASWTTISASPGGTGFPTANVGRIALVMAPSTPTRIWALVANSATSESLGIYITDTAASAPVTWTLKNSSTQYCSSQCWYNIHGAADPSDPNRLVVAGLDVYISSDSGTNFTQISSWFESGPTFAHADHHFLRMPASNRLYTACDGGLFVANLTGSTASWSGRNVGLATQQFYGFTQHPTDPNRFHGGLQDNGEAFYDGTTYRELQGGDGGESAWDQTSADHSYQEYIYAMLFRNSSMATDPDNSWVSLRNFGGCGGPPDWYCNPDGGTSFIAPFALDPNDGNRLYTGSYRAYRTSNARTGTPPTWTSISGDLTNGAGSLNYIHAAKNGGVAGRLYVGTSNGKLQTTANGTATPPTWSDVSLGLSGAVIGAVSTDPADGSRVLVVMKGFGGQQVFRSTTAGASWTNITGGLPAVPFNCIVLDPANSNRAIAGSDFGVYENTNVWSGTTWTDISGNLPAVSVAELGFNVSNGKLRAATHGRAIWELSRSALGTPRENSPGNQLRVSKASGTSLSVIHTPGLCSQDHTVYTGSLSALGTSGIAWTARYCNRGNSSPLTFDPGSSSDFYFSVVSNNSGGFEGSYGRSSGNFEYPAAGSGTGCSYVQDLAGTCP